MNTHKELIMESIDNIQHQQEDAEYYVALSLIHECVKMIDITENCKNDNTSEFKIFQESLIFTEATDLINTTNTIQEPLLKKILLFIPRMIKSIIDMIRNKFGKNKNEKFETPVTQPEEIEDIEKELKDKHSGLSKAILAAGCVGIATTAVGFAFSISDFSKAVEFKDDVSFTIAKDLSELRIVFPFYKVDGIIEFNKDFKDALNKLNSNSHDIKTIYHLLKKTSTNQARVSERVFKNPAEWDDYFNNTISKEFNQFADNLKELNENFTKFKQDYIDQSNEDDKETVIKLTKYIESYAGKIPGDIELITKFNKKLHDVYNILCNKNSPKYNKMVKKFTYDPVFSKDIINIYKIDTSKLDQAVKQFNQMASNVINEIETKKSFNDITKEDIHKYIKANPTEINNIMKLIEQQFNCKIKSDLCEIGGATNTSAGKKGEGDIDFSDKTGFDLKGAKIQIYIDPSYAIISGFTEDVSGQIFCSIVCHEIFHNIARFMNIYNTKFQQALQETIAHLYVIDPAMAVIKILDLIISKFTQVFGNSYVKNNITERRLCYLIINSDNTRNIDDFIQHVADNTDNKYLDDIDVYMEDPSKKDLFLSKLNRFKNSISGRALMNGLAAIFLRHHIIIGGLVGFTAAIGGALGLMHDVKMGKTNEETMCDMCATLYKLPSHFYYDPYIKKSKSARELKSHGVYDVHSATIDREIVSTGIAQQMLNSGEPLSPETRKYLEFIIDNNEGIEFMDRHLTKRQLKQSAPAFNDNIGRAITQFMKDHNITVKKDS